MITKSNKPRARRLAGFIAAIGVLLASSGVALMATASPANAANEKFFVCKYVGTPGVDEILQTGQNPISVSINAIPLPPADVIPGAEFEDQHGRSVVLVEDTGQADPPRSACEPAEAEVVTVDVVFTDPTCDNDNVASYEVTGDTENVTVEESAAPAPGVEVAVTATANEGFLFETEDGGVATYSETHTFGDAADCSVAPPTPTPTTVVDPPAATPTVVEAGLIGSSSASSADMRIQPGLLLLAIGMLLLVIAGGVAMPRGARR
jgi:hypothetical protein